MSKCEPKIFLALFVAMTLIAATSHAASDARSGSIQGVVRNASGEAVSGALVKFNNAARRLTFMVPSQARGRYRIGNLPSGKYVVQGVGGDFQSPMSAPVDVGPGQVRKVDLSLTSPRAPQLPNAWPGLQPGQEGGEAAAGTKPLILPEGAGKHIVQTKCTVCHDVARIVHAQHDRKQWEITIQNMRLYSQGSTVAKDLTDQEAKILLDYVSKNFSANQKGRARPKPDPNSRLPRKLLRGEALNYIAVEYLLPDPKVEPHEIAVDSEGNGWVTQRTGGRLGRLDLKTLRYREINPPPGRSKKVRLNAIVRAPDGKLWFVDAGPNRRWFSYDPEAGEFNAFVLPKMKNGTVSGNTMRVSQNGTVWMCSIISNQIIRLDPVTRKFTVYDVPSGVKAKKNALPYGMAISGDGKIWFVENAMNKIGRVDPATGKIDEFEVPLPHAVPRKAGTDSKGNIWVGLHGAGKLMKIDYKTLKMTIYSPPTKSAGVYSVQGDPKTKYVWFSEQEADKIGRFDPATKTFVEFPLPNAVEDARRIDIDPTNPNRIWWSGNTSGRMGYIQVMDGKSN